MIKDNGGAAFPWSDGCQRKSGMTLRDYFIAHAPAEPQPWFEPVLPPKADSIPHFTVLYPDCTANEVKALRDYDDEYMAPDSVQEERVRNYLVHKESERNRDREYGRMADRERYIQWPAAWADAMLEARKG